MKEALVEKTLKVIDGISEMDFVKAYFLVGGTALSLQIRHRLSEDLDFMQWLSTKKDKPNIDIAKIKRELNDNYVIDSVDILDHNHVEIHLNGGVKLSFYIPAKKKPAIKPVHYLNNLVLIDEDCIAALKMEVLMRRTEFRDYYDLYCILKYKTDEEIKQIIQNALRYSEYNLKSKNLIGILTNSERFLNSTAFSQLEPKYSISAKEIECFMIEKMKNIF